MKTEAMSSPQADAENTNKALPELPNRWKSRLQRFQSSLRRSVRLKKRNSPQSTSFVDGEHRAVLENDHENCLANRSEKHVREILAKDKHNGAPTKQLNGTKITSHSHYANGKTSLDSYGFDKRKFEQNKTNGNNNQRKKKNVADSTWRPAHVSELAVCSQVGSALPKKSHKSKRQRANTNTERTSLSKSKSLSILTNLFKRSSHSKDKNNRGKNSSFADAETSLSKDFTSTANSTDFDALVTDTVVSSSSIDSFGDNDSRFKGKYYSLKRSKKSLIFPKNYLARSFSLDNSLDPCNDSLMEKSRTLAAIPPCIRVEEYRENCGFFERSLTVEFNPGSCGSVTIDTGHDCREKLTGCSDSRTAEVLDSSSHSSGARKNGVEQETVPNITHVAEKSSDAWKRRSAPPILSFSADKSSSNIGSPIFYELKTDIAKVENRSQLESKTDECQSNFSEKGNSSSETVECSDILKSDMGNNLSYGLQKPRKFNSKDVKFKSAMLRSIKKNGKTFHVKSYDGEEDPIIEQTDYLESFEQEPENERLYYLAKDVNLVNELTKDKSNSLYEGTEALGISEHMIDALQGNNYTQDFSDVKSTADWNSSENQLKENQPVEEKCACENTERLPNERVNKEEEVCEEKFCSATFGQTGHNDSYKQGDCLSCNETRNKLTDTELRRCLPVFPDTSSQEVNPGVLSEQKLRDHIARELITCGLREICNSGQGLARNLKVNSLPCSPRDTVVPAGTMHSSFPDIRKLHSQQLSSKLLDSSDSFSSCSLHVENSFENNGSIDRGGNVNNPLLSNDLSNCSKHGGILKSNLSPAPPEERQRSCSARISSKSPLHQVLQTENRSASCSQLDRDGNDNSICTSPPYVRPRIQSLEELPPCTAAVILRKKKSIIRKTRMKHTASLSFVGNEFNNMIDKSKRHSYGGYSDRTFLELPHLLHRSQSAESQLDSCNSSLQSLNSSSSFTENELGSTFSIMSELSIPGGLDKSLGRSRSVPGFLGTADIRQNSPIPEERVSLSEMEWPSKSAENSDDDVDDDDDDDVDGEMDVPEAFAEALWDHVTMDPEELSFQAGDIITVLTMTSCEWWFGQVGDQVGWFPAPFVRVRVSQTLAAEETKLALPVRTRKGTFEGFLSDDVIRSRVVLEVLNTERDYVKNLEDVVEGYLKQARKRTDMFSEEQIVKIFSNIEDIYLFNQKILRQLEECFMEDDPHASEIGAVFLNNKQGFDIYSEYCNNHPHAMAELKTLCKSNKYKQFFEACRLLRDMISISLDGFLLTPVQKICKYPLQLAELKKHTSPVHKDFQTVKQALETMKDVASLINERKRKVESINKIAKWQSTIEGWEGENVLERSSELIHSGDVVKTGNGSSQDRVMFLFDHQLVYCKKDILKKNGLTYKGRIDMDDCTVIWLRDGEETLDRSPLNNAWKIYNFKKEKWYIFFTKKAAHKERWIKAFEDERRRVKEDAKTGLIISQNTRKAAMRAAKASMKHKKVNGKKEKPFQKTQSTREIKAPPSPTLQLPDPISSADLKEQEEEDKEFGRSSVIRRSFGLRGSKKGNKDKRLSSVF